MDKQQLFENIKRKKSFLCVGLDTDIKKIPEHLLKEEDPIFAFNKAIIDATADLCIAYKPNLAFYESMGVLHADAVDAAGIPCLRRNLADCRTESADDGVFLHRHDVAEAACQLCNLLRVNRFQAREGHDFRRNAALG